MHSRFRYRLGPCLLATAVALRLAWGFAPDPIIEAARTAAAAYQNSLPNYIAKRTTTRYRGARARRFQSYGPGAVIAWQAVDTVIGEVTAFQGKEVYTNITINGEPTAQLPKWGAWSTGEFAVVLISILPPERAAKFAHQRNEHLRNRAAVRYDFAVDKPHSAWRLDAGRLPGMHGQGYLTAYAGAIWVDRQTGQTLRVEMSARGLPRGFALSSVESRTDFDFVQIGDREYLLPTHSQALTCESKDLICLKNETVFSGYDKFVADSNVSFENIAK